MSQVPGHRQFGSTEHLASEAIAAYVDGELRMSAYLRAAHHLSMCPECAHEVESQQQARRALRGSGEVTMPLSLLGVLSRIPTCQPADSFDHAAEAARGTGMGSALPEQLDVTGRRWSRRWRR
ncbi:zf-HC2 domain-containing protein [Rhodococcus sp. NPDC058521]|uniref:zf-HC2 domain-containing protein n=1 Tax=Rhodococcus sp. NPDC058521 TaxID=3346536 RepID=UPI003663FD9C